MREVKRVKKEDLNLPIIDQFKFGVVDLFCMLYLSALMVVKYINWHNNTFNTQYLLNYYKMFATFEENKLIMIMFGYAMLLSFSIAYLIYRYYKYSMYKNQTVLESMLDQVEDADEIMEMYANLQRQFFAKMLIICLIGLILVLSIR